MEPDLSPDISLAFFSPEAGVLDSRAFIESLEKDIGKSDSDSVVYFTRVVRVDPYDKQPGCVVHMVTENGKLIACLRAVWSVQPASGPSIPNSS